jgi:hypothetical protein
VLGQLEELGPVAVDAERVRQGERNLAPGSTGDVHALGQGGLGLGKVPQVALAEHDLGTGDERFVDVGG